MLKAVQGGPKKNIYLIENRKLKIEPDRIESEVKDSPKGAFSVSGTSLPPGRGLPAESFATLN
jgi:hypothetical protein